MYCYNTNLKNIFQNNTNSFINDNSLEFITFKYIIQHLEVHKDYSNKIYSNLPKFYKNIINNYNIHLICEVCKKVSWCTKSYSNHVNKHHKDKFKASLVWTL